MTRLRRRILGGGLGVLAVSILTVGPWPLDRSPDGSHEALAIATITREGQDLQTRHAASPALPLQAGWAVEPFDLPDGIPLAGYGSRLNASSTGTMPNETLAARSIVLRSGGDPKSGQSHPPVAIVCTDILLVNAVVADAVRNQVQAQLGPRTPMLLFTATHTHSGPGAWGEMVFEELIAGRHDPDVVEELVRALSQSVLAAVAALEPASYAWISTQAPRYLRNRSVPGAEVDSTLEALVLKKTHASTAKTAVLALFGAHATCLPDENLKLSADYPGHLVRSLEASEPVDFAAFAAGNMGSHSPVAKGNGDIRAANIGQGLAKLLLAQLEVATFHPSARLSACEPEVATPPLQLRIGPSLRFSSLVTNWTHPPRARLFALRLDDHLWLGVPMEVSGLLSKPLRNFAVDSGLSGLTMSNFQGDYLGYVIPDALYADGSVYESQMGFLGPSGGSYFDHLIRALLATQLPRQSTSDSR